MTASLMMWLLPVGGAIVGYLARYWQTHTKTDGRETPVLDRLADLLAKALGQNAQPQIPPVNTGHPVMDKLFEEFLKRLLAQNSADPPPAK